MAHDLPKSFLRRQTCTVYRGILFFLRLLFVNTSAVATAINVVTIAMNATNGTTACLLRCTFDTIYLDADSSFSLILQVCPTQG